VNLSVHSEMATESHGINCQTTFGMYKIVSLSIIFKKFWFIGNKFGIIILKIRKQYNISYNG